MHAGRMDARRSARPSAIDRAKVLWGECAVAIREDLRAAGVRGSLRRLDSYTRGAQQRGVSAPTKLAELAKEMRDHGLPQEAALARVRNMAEQIVLLMYRDAAS